MVEWLIGLKLRGDLGNYLVKSPKTGETELPFLSVSSKSRQTLRF